MRYFNLVSPVRRQQRFWLEQENLLFHGHGNEEGQDRVTSSGLHTAFNQGFACRQTSGNRRQPLQIAVTATLDAVEVHGLQLLGQRAALAAANLAAVQLTDR